MRKSLVAMLRVCRLTSIPLFSILAQLIVIPLKPFSNGRFLTPMRSVPLLIVIVYAKINRQT